MQDLVFLSVASLNHLPKARCLFESLRTHHPEARPVLCLTEEEVDAGLVEADEFEIILAKDVVGDGFYDMALRYDIIELNPAVKPFALRWLLDNGAQQVAYLDADCFVFSPLEEVGQLHADGANIVLTPHATKPIDDSSTPGEIDLLRVGTFNLGFVSVRDTEVTRRFLDWWADRLRKGCQYDPVSGLFVDQKWVDLAPCFFEGVRLLRHPGYNVAYWNAFQRNLERLPGGWHVDGEPLRFFHFSSLPEEDVSQIAHHQNRLTPTSLGPFFAEFQTYLARLASNRLSGREQRPYSYSITWRGEPIESPAVRAALRRLQDVSTPRSLADLRDERAIARLLEPHPDLPVGEMFPISRLLYDAWLHAPMIAQEYPLLTAEGRARFFYWVLDGGYAALRIDPTLLPWTELAEPVPAAVGGRLAVPPLLWLVWLADERLRRAVHLKDEATYANLLIELQKQVSQGERPAWVLPGGYTSRVVVGDGDDAVNVAQYAIWCSRKDLQRTFDLETPQARRNFLAWCAGPSPATECPWMTPLIGSRTNDRDAA